MGGRTLLRHSQDPSPAPRPRCLPRHFSCPGKAGLELLGKAGAACPRMGVLPRFIPGQALPTSLLGLGVGFCVLFQVTRGHFAVCHDRK